MWRTTRETSRLCKHHAYSLLSCLLTGFVLYIQNCKTYTKIYCSLRLAIQQPAAVKTRRSVSYHKSNQKNYKQFCHVSGIETIQVVMLCVTWQQRIAKCMDAYVTADNFVYCLTSLIFCRSLLIRLGPARSDAEEPLGICGARFFLQAGCHFCQQCQSTGGRCF